MSEAAKFTAGPWRVSELGMWVGEPRCVIVAADKSGQRHSRIDRTGAFKAPDARLIAAAPDLLAALQSLLVYADGIHRLQAHNDGEEVNYETFPDARAAISRATTPA